MEQTYTHSVMMAVLKRDVEAAVTAEREACAAILDDKAQELNRLRDPGMANHLRMLARAIRSRTN